MAGNLTAMIAAIFSGEVTPDPYYEYTTLLLPGNGTNGAQNNTFLDGSTNNFTITRNGNTTQGTFSPFSQTGWGNYFDGSGDYINTVDNAALDVGSSAFTFEFWFFNQQNAQSGSFAGIGLIASKSDYNGSNSNGWSLYCYDGSNLTTPSSKLTFFANGISYAATTSDGAAPFNTWTHIAVVKNGTNLTIYSNGVAVVTSSSAPSTINDTSTGFYIGSTVSGVTWNNTFPSRGYISNARLVKGVAVYTGAFTPPTSPLEATQSAGTNISAITGTQTSLLTCQSNRFIDNSTNNFTITRNGDTRVVAFSPFNPTASWSAATYGGSGYFDGSGDYLSVADNTAWDFGSGNFTVECWYYPTTSNAQQVMVAQWDGVGGGTGLSWALFTSNDTNRYLRFATSTNGSGVSFDLVSTTSVVLNAWNHVAIVRNGNTFQLYLNGTAATGGSTTSAITLYNATNSLTIGATSSGTQLATGYLSNTRIVKGTAVYTGAFTPPTAPITNAGSTSAASYPSTTNVNTSFASSDTKLLLNFTNAGIYDATGKNDLETVGNAQISTAQSKWGSSSIYLDGTGDYLASAATNLPLTFNTGDFTIEGWLYPASVSGGSITIVSNRFDAGADTVLIFGFGTTYGLYFHTQNTAVLSSGTNLTANTWQNVVLCRASGTVRIFLGGTQVGSSTSSAQNLSSTASMFVGQDGTRTSPALQYNGYLQDLRITRGYARYTANFTPPTSAFPTL